MTAGVRVRETHLRRTEGVGHDEGWATMRGPTRGCEERGKGLGWTSTTRDREENQVPGTDCRKRTSVGEVLRPSQLTRVSCEGNCFTVVYKPGMNVNSVGHVRCIFRTWTSFDLLVLVSEKKIFFRRRESYIWLNSQI